jgi:hypothetical protein
VSSFISSGRDGRVNLQATLAATSATGHWDGQLQPHHPITCGSDLHYNEDGSFCCAHTSAPPDDLRTQFCLDHSVALLLLELGEQL